MSSQEEAGKIKTKRKTRGKRTKGEEAIALQLHHQRRWMWDSAFPSVPSLLRQGNPPFGLSPSVEFQIMAHLVPFSLQAIPHPTVLRVMTTLSQFPINHQHSSAVWLIFPSGGCWLRRCLWACVSLQPGVAECERRDPQRLDSGTLERSGNCSVPKYVKMIDEVSAKSLLLYVRRIQDQV